MEKMVAFCGIVCTECPAFIATQKETSMTNFIFRMMTTVMKIRGIFRNKKREVLLTGIKEGDIVLDYGCGIGFNTIPAAWIVGEKGKVYALDIHPLAIKTVEMKIRKKGLVNIETILSGLDTGLPDESVDIILLYNVLPIIENQTDLIKELYRVLRSGGVLSVKSGLGVNLYSREKIKTNDLEKLMIDKGPLKLKKKIGKFYIFEKNNEGDKLLKETKKNGL